MCENHQLGDASYVSKLQELQADAGLLFSLPLSNTTPVPITMINATNTESSSLLWEPQAHSCRCKVLQKTFESQFVLLSVVKIARPRAFRQSCEGTSTGKGQLRGGGGLKREESVACVFAQGDGSGAYLSPQSQPAASRSKGGREKRGGFDAWEAAHIPGRSLLSFKDEVRMMGERDTEVQQKCETVQTSKHTLPHEHTEASPASLQPAPVIHTQSGSSRSIHCPLTSQSVTPPLLLLVQASCRCTGCLRSSPSSF